MTETVQWYLNPVGSYGLVAIVLAVLIALLFLVPVARGRLSAGRRAVLLALRLALLALFAFALLRPSLVQNTTKKQPATLVILADRSRSMMVADAFGNQTRWAQLERALQSGLPKLATLSEKNEIDVRLYTFDESLEAVDWDVRKTDAQVPLAKTATGQQTALGAALEDVLRRESGKRLLGVVLLSDGAQRAYAPRDTPPQTPARRLADLGYPLFTFPFGQPRGADQSRDVALVDMLVNPTVFVKNELAILGSVRVDGYPNRPIPLQLWFESPTGKMEQVGVQELAAQQSGEGIPFELSYVPQVPGEYKVSLRIPQQPDELLTTNNELSSFVTVRSGGLNVLYLEGALRVEQKFIRRALDASPDIEVDYVRVQARNPATRESLLERFRRGRYDVYLLGDIDASQFSPEELAALAEVVRGGAGLMMLGGFHTFGPGGYGDTPLADLLPLRMNALERQPFDEPIRPDVHLSGKQKMLPAEPLGSRHFVMSLAEGAANRALWNQLPPLDGANRFDELKPNANVLAETADKKPLLLAAEAGGRVMAFAGDSTWHWWLKGFESAHKRFWRQVILWLARRDQATEGNVWVNLGQRRFAPNARVDFAVGALSPQGDVEQAVTFKVDVVAPDGTRRAASIAKTADEFRGFFNETRQAGDYAIEVTASKQGVELGKARARFLVFEQDLELDNPAADPALLASLAKMTAASGGQSLAPEEFPALIERLLDQPAELEIETQVKHTPWDTWPFFMAFVTLMSVEWYLRKRWGLV